MSPTERGQRHLTIQNKMQKVRKNWNKELNKIDIKSGKPAIKTAKLVKNMSSVDIVVVSPVAAFRPEPVSAVRAVASLSSPSPQLSATLSPPNTNKSRPHSYTARLDIRPHGLNLRTVISDQSQQILLQVLRFATATCQRTMLVSF